MTYKPSALAYPPIVAGTPAPYPLTRPMGPYMSPAAGYAPHYVPFHRPHRAYGATDITLPKAVAGSGIMLVGFPLVGLLLSGVAYLGGSLVTDTVFPMNKRSPRTNAIIENALQVAGIVPVVAGVGFGLLGAYTVFQKYAEQE